MPLWTRKHQRRRPGHPALDNPVCSFAVLLLLISLATSAHATATVIIVPDDYPTIQQAINAAQDGDTVTILPGTYHEAINLLGKAITVRSAEGPDVTVIDAIGLNTSAVTMTSGEGSGTIIQGLTIRRGRGTMIDGTRYGGGILVVGPVEPPGPMVTDSRIVENTQSSRGSGIALLNGGALTITDSLIAENIAWSWGGGIYVVENGQIEIVNSTIKANEAQRGGGIYAVDAQIMLKESDFTANLATNIVSHTGAGSAVRGQNSILIAEFCHFVDNVVEPEWGSGGSSKSAGAIAMSMSTTHVSNCTFVGNRATEWSASSIYGGAMSLVAGQSTIEDTLFKMNTVFSGDYPGGGAVWLSGSDAVVRNCVFLNNSVDPDGLAFAGHAGAMRIDGPAIVENCTFLGNTTSRIGGAMMVGGGTLVRDCAFEGNRSTHQGGAAAMLIGGPVPSARFERCIFRSNTARTAGALEALYDCEIVDCTFISNNAVYTSSILPTGGAITAGGWAVEKVLIDGCTFAGNTSEGVGGAVNFRTLVTDGLTLEIRDTHFTDNVSESDGGGIFARVSEGKTANMVISHVTIRRNTSETSGGGMFIEENVNTFIGDSEFCENEPDDIVGEWIDEGGNEFLDECEDPKPGDLNGDGVVDGADLGILLANWGDCADCDDCIADLNGDCTVDGADLGILLANWGE